MTQYLNPFSGRQFSDASKVPYSGAKLFIYAAGSSTKVTTTQDQAGLSNHANPIILNARGEPADAGGASQAIWQPGSTPVKLVLAPATDTDPPLSAISSWDNITGINDAALTIDQWISGPTPTYVSGTQFTLVGDQTSTWHVGRRIKATVTAGTVYGTITVSAYTSLTTITVVLDSGVLDSGLSSVNYGILSSTSGAIPGKIAHMVSFDSGIGPSYLQNIGLTATVASKALTISLKTKALADPSAGSPQQTAFRNATLTTGDYNIRSAIAATSLVFPSGATGGFVANEASNFYIYQLDNAGTIELAISKSGAFYETTVQSTTAISAAADSGTVLYSTTARSNVPIRLVGKVSITTGAVAGEWDNAPTNIYVGKTNYLTSINNSLGADVLLNNVANFFTGPSVAQGTEGTWFASGTVSMIASANPTVYIIKLWDGTTVLSSTTLYSPTAGYFSTVSLSGIITSPTGNIRISVKDLSGTTGRILYNSTGESKDSTLTAIRMY